MITVKRVKELVTPVLLEEGVSLYDVDLPRGRSGALRLFVYKGEPGKSTLGLEECAAVSKKLLNLDQVDELLPGDTRLEVSSPGVNRKLRNEEHFSSVTGERVKLTYYCSEGQRTVTGIVSAFDGGTLFLKENEGDVAHEIAVESIKTARVDFEF